MAYNKFYSHLHFISTHYWAFSLLTLATITSCSVSLTTKSLLLVLSWIEKSPIFSSGAFLQVLNQLSFYPIIIHEFFYSNHGISLVQCETRIFVALIFICSFQLFLPCSFLGFVVLIKFLSCSCWLMTAEHWLLWI